MKRDVFLASLLFGILMFASFIVVYQYVLGTSFKESVYLSLPVALLSSITWGGYCLLLKEETNEKLIEKQRITCSILY